MLNAANCVVMDSLFINAIELDVHVNLRDDEQPIASLPIKVLVVSLLVVLETYFSYLLVYLFEQLRNKPPYVIVFVGVKIENLHPCKIYEEAMVNSLDPIHYPV